MEIFFNNLAYGVTEYEFGDTIANILHGYEFQQFAPPGYQLNFHFNLSRRTRYDRRSQNCIPENAGYGTLTIGSLPAAQYFLARFGGPGIVIAQRAVRFKKSNSTPPLGLVLDLQATPYESPELREQHDRDLELASVELGVARVEFGWRCRDGVFSIENSMTGWGSLVFEDGQQQLVVKAEQTKVDWLKDEDFDELLNNLLLGDTSSPASTRPAPPLPNPAIVVKYRFIDVCTIPASKSQEPSILLELNVAPRFEEEQSSIFDHYDFYVGRESPRKRRHYPSDELRQTCRYVARVIRIVLKSLGDVSQFQHAGELAGLYPPQRLDVRAEERGLFSTSTLDAVSVWLGTLPSSVAIQIEHLLLDHIIDARELLELSGSIDDLVKQLGKNGASQVLRGFASELKSSAWYLEDEQEAATFVPDLLGAHRDSTVLALSSPSPVNTDRSTVATLHVALAPASTTIDGPIAEQGNRILRRYADHQECFIRIAFVDDDGQTFRHERDTDISDLIRSHVLPVMREGYRLGGRRYHYLAYSQSALKQHSFWFVRSFKDSQGRTHNAETIRQGMGDFTADRFCPPRVAARMSLAFSATDPSSRLLPGERALARDIGGSGSACMTDGAGRMSVASADAIWEARGKAKGIRVPGSCPAVIQVRMGGDKGTLIKDPTLGPGRRIIVHDSMSKFTASEQDDGVEICKPFTRPGQAYLNRPLITVLEARGIPPSTFVHLQTNIVNTARDATKNFESAAALLTQNGLGGSFRLPAVLNQLAARSVDFPNVQTSLLEHKGFFKQTLNFAVNHVLRGLKFRGRIPLPDSWNLVGVPDFHGILDEGQIFVCVRETPLSQPIFLDGCVLVSRSPTSHPGDVMIMQAVGKPQPGTVYATHTPENCVIFSTKGNRSPASCLGGGDYDGDEYLVSRLEYLLNLEPAVPAQYKNSTRQRLDRPYNMDDITEFAANFIVNDQLPRIASTWLKLADAQELGPYHPDCLKLSELHAIACDYPKSGVPVNLTEIPHGPREDPDWSVSEVGAGRRKLYQSRKALGQLYRAIHITDEPISDEPQDTHRHNGQLSVAAALPQLRVGSNAITQHPLSALIQYWVGELVPDILEHPSLVDPEADDIKHAVSMINEFSKELRLICQHNTLARSRRAQLLEEEVVAGTIIAKTSGATFRRREDHMTRMNDQSERLYEKVQLELEASPATEGKVVAAWLGWKVSVVHGGFGAESFGLVALHSLFKAFAALEALEVTTSQPTSA